MFFYWEISVDISKTEFDRASVCCRLKIYGLFGKVKIYIYNRAERCLFKTVANTMGADYSTEFTEIKLKLRYIYIKLIVNN